MVSLLTYSILRVIASSMLTDVSKERRLGTLNMCVYSHLFCVIFDVKGAPECRCITPTSFDLRVNVARCLGYYSAETEWAWLRRQGRGQVLNGLRVGFPSAVLHHVSHFISVKC